PRCSQPAGVLATTRTAFAPGAMWTQVQPDKPASNRTEAATGTRRMAVFPEKKDAPDCGPVRLNRTALRTRLAVGVDHGDLAQLEVADRLLDLRQVADDHPGQGVRIDRRGRGGDLFRGQR